MIVDSGANSWPIRHFRSDLILVFVVYASLAYLASVTARAPGSVATIWVANATAMGLILSAPRSRRWALLATTAVANFAAELACGNSSRLALALVPPNVLEVFLGVVLTIERRALRVVSDHKWFAHVLIAGALAPPLVGAAVGAATLHTLGIAEFSRIWVDWFTASAIGAVAFLPLTLALRSLNSSAFKQWAADPRSLISLVAIAITTLLALRNLPHPFVVISVALMLIALNQQRLTTMAGTAVFVLVLAAALTDHWFVVPSNIAPHQHLLLFLSAMMTVIPAQLAAVFAARQRAVSQTLSAVGSRMDEIVVFSDMANRYRWVNNNRSNYWNQPNESVIGRTWQQNNPPGLYEERIKPLIEQARAGHTVRRTIEFPFPGRGMRTMDVMMQPARDEVGHQIGIVSCSKDVTEVEASRRELEQTAQQLLTANQSLEQFVRVASHDLREPLNTIVQFCQLIDDERRNRLSQPELLYFDQVRAGAARMKTILDDVLQYIKLDDPALRVAETVDLNIVVRQVLATLDAKIRRSNAQMVVEPLGSVAGHGAMISLVVQNLVANAIKFVPPERSPVIRINMIHTITESRLTVGDNGIGIAESKIGQLGIPFRRLQSRRVFEGTGLGLAICKRVAEQFGGRIEIRSELGKGSEFTFVLPNAPPLLPQGLEPIGQVGP